MHYVGHDKHMCPWILYVLVGTWVVKLAHTPVLAIFGLGNDRDEGVPVW